MSNESGCGMAFMGMFLGFVLTCFGAAILDNNTYKNFTVPFIKQYAEAKVLEIPVSLDTEGRIWLWNAQLGLSSTITREDLNKIIKQKKDTR